MLKPFMAILFIILSLIYSCNSRKTNAEIEVERIKSEIERINPIKNIQYFKGIAALIRKENDVFKLLIPIDKGYYTIINNEEIIEGYYRLNDDFISGEITNNESHSKRNISNKDRILVKNWLDFIDKYQIYGFEKNDIDTVTIYLKPNIRLIFLYGEVDKYYWGEWGGKGTEWKDPRGDLYIKLANDVFVATERR